MSQHEITRRDCLSEVHLNASERNDHVRGLAKQNRRPAAEIAWRMERARVYQAAAHDYHQLAKFLLALKASATIRQALQAGILGEEWREFIEKEFP